MDNRQLLWYDFGPSVQAFSTRRESELPFHVIRGHQVHDTRIAVIEEIAADLHKHPSELTRDDLYGFDALVTALPDVGIAVRTADCIPVLLFDHRKRVVAAVHAGWRGTVKRIVNKTLTLMMSRFSTLPEHVFAQIGPGIALTSFQVGCDVVARFQEAGFPMERIYRDCGPQSYNMKGGLHIDLKEANRFELISSGVHNNHVNVSEIDTYRDSSFFSARREGNDCGRITNGIRILPHALE